MKKLITALMILVVVFCFSACEPENDPTPPTTPTTPTTPADIDGPGTIDITTLDGIYVQTVNACGKPMNMVVYVIDGNSMSIYRTMPSEEHINDSFPNAAYFDSVSMKKYTTKTITRNDVTMTCSDGDDAYKLITNANGTWLVNVEHPDDLDDTFQKVERGHYGTPMSAGDYFLKDDAGLSVSYDDGKIVDVSVFTEESGYETLDGTTIGNTYTADGLYERYSEQDISDGTFTVTVNGNTATVSNASGFLNEDATVVSGTYTRYIRTTPWPAAPAAE